MVVKSGHEWTVPIVRYIFLKNSNLILWITLNGETERPDSLLSEISRVIILLFVLMSQDDAENLRRLMFRFIDESRKVIGPSKEEELFV